MSVRNALEKMLESASLDAAEQQEIRRWLGRTEVFLDWIAKHPRLVEINCEAGHLLALYRGEVSAPPVDVDYRGIGRRREATAP